MDKGQALKKYFGHTSFRRGQEELVDAILAGRDVFGVMPTGGGKSICYQLPALMLPGTALVISPLISLMKDQVMALKSAGVPGTFVNSSLSADELRLVYQNIRAGKYKIVYIAPERLESDSFLALAQRMDISLVAVDEAHCISQWGQDFRPSYLRIVDFLEKLPQRVTLAAFTATATVQVRQDVARILCLQDPLLVATGFDRPNLNFEVRRPKNKNAVLKALVAAQSGKSGIIYCATRNSVEKICETLCAQGIPATRYHAGLSPNERRENQEDFLFDRKPVMVATNAFGMGIDKSNVSFVIHYNMPKSLEAYYQEAGRAGRDGERADCILLFSPGDVQTAKFFIQNSNENEDLSPDQREQVTRRDYERLKVMADYCKTSACLRGYILDYFGQEHEESCQNCGNCRTHFEVQDITSEAQMILSCIKRAHDRLGYSLGATLIVNCLCGSADKRVLGLGLDKLSTYGLMKKTAKRQIKDMIEYLEGEGYIYTDPRHGGMELTKAAGEVLFRGKKITMTVREPAQIKKDKKGRTDAPLPPNISGDLYENLKALRFELAKEEGVPAYIVFSNATLADMAAKAPTTQEDFLEVSGVGSVKAAKYAGRFIDRIKLFNAGKD